MGYKTSAMHGATGMMYDRQDWYAEVGFPDDLFFEDVLSLPRCYSFPGACDRNLLTHLRGYFSGEGKRFFYWLTLNTHSSYDRRDLVEDLFDCPAFGVEEDTQPCRNLELQAQFFNDLATALQSPEMAGVEVIVVGDHEPRLTNQMELKNNFMPGVVPWVRLKVE
jgi:phosphoglycerol transferase MdoB-like AlkP superfamily enzyme